MKNLVSVFVMSAVGLSFAPMAGCAHAEPDLAAVAPEPAPIIRDVAAIIVPVVSLEASEAFYQGVLGAEFVRRSDTDHYLEAIYGFPGNSGARLVLIQSLDKETALSSVRIVFNANDIDAVFAGLADQHVEIEREPTPIPGAGGLRIGIIKDADGNTLEFIQR